MKRLWLILFLLLTQALIFSQNSVIVNTKTGRIHNFGVLHLPDSLDQKEYKNKDLAVKDGFEFCKACFDLRPELFDYDLEKQLTSQAIIAIKNRYEIMYEHERLEFLNGLMGVVLKRWPEELRGYSYRLQIIRDEAPNALAIAGGNIYLTTGLIDMVENDAELESVLVHEIAHVERRHTLRSFKEYQKKQLGVKALALLMTTLSLASGNQNVDALSQLTKILTEYSAILAIKGYSRDLEMEADMFAQLYFKENQLNERSIITVLDRFATYTTTRLGYISNVNAFSDHPAILNRIRQVENGRFYRYPIPLKMYLNPVGILLKERPGEAPQVKPQYLLNQNDKLLLSGIDNGFISIEIDKYYVSESSDSRNHEELLILGRIINRDRYQNYTINKIDLKYLNAIIPINGLADVSILAGEQADFFGRIKVMQYLMDTVEKSFKNKDINPYLISISPIDVRENKKLKKSVWGPKIMCEVIIE